MLLATGVIIAAVVLIVVGQDERATQTLLNPESGQATGPLRMDSVPQNDGPLSGFRIHVPPSCFLHPTKLDSMGGRVVS